MTDRNVLIHPEVSVALAEGRGVVALESTLITHGLPWPVNFETARRSQEAVIASGAVPATICILAGVIQIGLSDDQLEMLARSNDFVKAGRRELGWIIAARKNAATTVSSTLFLARQFGIGVMATGGLGGVHRGANESFDISNDLDELAKAEGSLVVCSGFKSILDVAATHEMLETLGVLVLGYRTDELPAFTTYSSGLKLENRVESPEQVAHCLQHHRDLKVPGGVVLAQPVDPSVALDRERMEKSLRHALVDAEKSGIRGKEMTPFLLERIHKDTNGLSLVANQALIVANAGLAGQVATCLSEMV